MLGAGLAATAHRKRLFFALWPDEPTRLLVAAAGEAAAAAAGIRGRRIPLPRIHLTLLFLGDLDAAGEERARAVADAAAGLSPAFDLTLDRVGSFHRSRVLWVGARHTPEALTGLWLALRDDLADLVGERNRGALAPHVTCYRDIDRPLRIAPIAPIRWRADGFVLVHSTLGHPPEYHVVSHWPLQTAST